MPTKPVRMRLAALTAVALMLVAALVTGCQNLMPQTGSTQPAAAADSACVAHCDLKKSQCEQRQLLREQDCQQSKAQITADQRRCSPSEGVLCVQALECLGADMGLCQTQFDACVANCRPGVATQTTAADKASDDVASDPR